MDFLDRIIAKKLYGGGNAGGGGGGGSGGGGNTGGGEEWFNDGNTHLWVSLPEGATSPVVGVGVNGTVTVDWGDGTTPDVLTGTNAGSRKYTPAHEYAAAGDYVITLAVDGEMRLFGSSGEARGSYLFCRSEYDYLNETYHSSLNRVELGDNVTNIGDYAFARFVNLSEIILSDSVVSIGSSAFDACHTLREITIPASVTSTGTNPFSDYSCLTKAVILDGAKVGTHLFNACRMLLEVVLPNNMTAIGNLMFSDCMNLRKITVPESVTSIGVNAFYNNLSLLSISIPASVTEILRSAFDRCRCIKLFDFSNHTTVPTLGATSAFDNIPSDCEFRIPSALYDEWIAATNWSAVAATYTFVAV